MVFISLKFRETQCTKCTMNDVKPKIAGDGVMLRFQYYKLCQQNNPQSVVKIFSFNCNIAIIIFRFKY